MSSDSNQAPAQFLSLWPTNVLIRQLPLSPESNQEIASTAKSFYQTQVSAAGPFPYRGSTVSIFNTVRLPAFASLFSEIEASFQLYVKKFYPGVEWEDLHATYNSFVNCQRKKTKWVIPHAHVGNQLVATYYPEVILGKAESAETQPGALCFHDPRPVHANWMVRKENKLHSIQQKPGTLIVFPGFAEHSTFPFFDETSEKVAIVTNLRFSLKVDSNKERYFTADETRQFQIE